jgi:hypothetical protein
MVFQPPKTTSYRLPTNRGTGGSRAQDAEGRRRGTRFGYRAHRWRVSGAAEGIDEHVVDLPGTAAALDGGHHQGGRDEEPRPNASAASWSRPLSREVSRRRGLADEARVGKRLERERLAGVAGGRSVLRDVASVLRQRCIGLGGARASAGGLRDGSIGTGMLGSWPASSQSDSAVS